MPVRTRRSEAEPIELVIDDIAPTGEGVAHLVSGEAVFVPATIPGEAILATVVNGRPRRGSVLKVLRPSPARVEPDCPEVVRCGGCDFMHLAPDAQKHWHLDHLRRALERALSSFGVELPGVNYRAAPTPLAYRTRARLRVAANGRHTKIGFRGVRSHELVAVSSCSVLEPALGSALVELPKLLAGSRGDGEAMLALGKGRLPVVELQFVGTLSSDTLRAIDLAVEHGQFAGFRVSLDRARIPLTFGDPRPVIRAADGLELFLAPGGFGQASEDAASALALRVSELAAATGATKAVELFAGCGTLTVMLARRVAELAATEQDPSAVESLRDNVVRRGLSVKARCADANTTALPKADLVVLDPPRGGAPGAIARVIEAKPKHVIYVSCNAATLARDLAVLVEGRYRPVTLDVFDVFPQTSHFETIVSLVR